MYQHTFLDPPVRQKAVRKDVIAYQYRNGVVQIEKQRYFFYSMTAAIAQWRKQNPKK